MIRVKHTILLQIKQHVYQFSLGMLRLDVIFKKQHCIQTLDLPAVIPSVIIIKKNVVHTIIGYTFRLLVKFKEILIIGTLVKTVTFFTIIEFI